MGAVIEPPSEKLLILTNILKVLCVLTILTGIFKLPTQQFDTSSLIYFISGVVYLLSWRGLSYYGCLMNQCINVAMVFNLLQEVEVG